MQKMFLILSFVSSLVLALGTSVMANSVYAEGMFGTWDYTRDYGFKAGNYIYSFILGGDYSIGRYKLTLEDMEGREEAYQSFNAVNPRKSINIPERNFTAFSIKSGFILVKNPKFNMDLTLTYYGQKFDSAIHQKLYGYLVGADILYNLDEKACLTGSIGFPVQGCYEYYLSSINYHYDASRFLYNLKYIYFYTAKIGGTVSYRYCKNSVDEMGLKWIQSGLTVGVTYKF